MLDLFDQQRIMRAAQDERIDLRIGSQNIVMLPHEIIRSRGIKLIILHQGTHMGKPRLSLGYVDTSCRSRSYKNWT